MTWRSGLSPPPAPVDGQPRMSLQYKTDDDNLKNQALLGILVSVTLAVMFFVVILIA